MTLLRDDEQAALAEINGWGNSLLLRYRELADIDERLQVLLQDIVERRRVLLDQVADCARARHDLPKAEDQEMTQLKTLTDRLFDYLAGSEAMITRLLETETAWLDRLKELETLDWNPTELDLIEQLQRDAESALQRLGEI
jgi:hypothetical protein